MSKTRMGKRIASLLLSLVMMLSLLPTTVYAAADTADKNGVSVVGSTAPAAAQEEGVDNAAAGEGENGDVGENGGDAVTGDAADSALTTQSGDTEMPVTYAEGETETVVAKIGETGYATLADAIADAAEGDTIRVLADATLDDDLTKGNITIEGVVTNGVKPTIVENHWFKASNVTIKNLKLVRNDRLGIQSCSNVTFENCEITRSESYTSGALVDIKTGTSNVFFKDCQITNLEICEQALVRTRENAENVVFTNCTLDNAGTTSCIYAQGKNLTLTGCTLKNADFGIYCDGFNGTLTVDNCTFTNLPTNVGRADTTPAAAFEFKNSDLAGYVGFVEGATVTFTDCHFTKASKLDGTYNPDWNQVFTCCDVAFENCTFTEDYLGMVYVSVDTPKKVIVMNGCDIVDTDGRTVEGKTAADLVSTNMTTGANPSGVLAIDAETNDAGEYTGGTFVGSVENINNVLADGYVYNAADKTVNADTSVAAIGTTKYASLAAAIKAANTGDTITLLKDVDLDDGEQYLYSTATDKKDVHNLTFDLDGHKITSSSTSYTVSASREGLVIKNGTIENTASKTTYGAIYAPFSTKGTHSLTLENVTVIAKDTGIYATTTNGNATVTIGDKTTINAATGIEVVGADAKARTGTLKLNVSAGTVTGTKCGIHVTGPTNKNEIAAVTVTITGGEVSSMTINSGSGRRGANVAISGGTVTGALESVGIVEDAITITGGTFKGAVTKKNTKGTISISGGTFAIEPDKTYLAEGYTITQNPDDGTYGVTKDKVNVAEVNGKQYESLQAAIDVAAEKATVTLLADTRENVAISTNRLTLDLNGHTLNGGTVADKPALTVTAARVTVKDSSEKQTGTIMREDTAENSGVSSHYVIDIQGSGLLFFESGNVTNNSGTTEGKGASLVRVGGDSVAKYPGLTIKGGTFTQNNFIAIKVERGTFYLNDGEVNSANSYAIENWHNATIKGGTVKGAVAAWTYSGGQKSDLTISGGTVNGDVTSVNYGSAEGKVAKVSITGGTVNGELDTRSYDPETGELTHSDDATKATIKITGGTFSSDPTKYLVEGSTATKNSDGTFGVEKAYLAKVGDTSYYTMDEAFKAQTTSGEAIVLLRDYTTGGTFNSGSINRTVDLNGFTWTCTGTDANSAAFEVNYPDVTLTVKRGKVASSQLVGLIPSAMGGTIKYDNSGLVFEGVEMSTTATSGIETNGNNTNDTVTLRNSTLNVPNGFGIYFPSSGTLTIDNSTITAKTMGVQVCAGSLSITGEKTAITVTGDAVEKTEGDGAIQDGAAISIVNRTGYKGLDKIEVTGGKFTAKTGNAAIKAYNWENQTESEWADAGKYINVSGGTFSSAVDADLCKTGYAPTVNEDGTCTVTKVKVAEVNSTQYDTLEAAIAAAKDGDTVKLIANFTTDASKTQKADRLTVTTDVTLDLNGCTLTIPGELEDSSNWAAFYIKGATMTVKDSSANGTGAICGADKTVENPKYQGGVFLFDVNGDGALFIESGTYYAGGTVVQVTQGTATVNGGSFSVYPDVGTKDSRYLLNCIDAKYKAGTAHIVVNGGTFVGYDPRNNKAEGEGTDFVAPGVGVNADADGNFVAKANMLVQLVDAEGNSVAAYDTLWEAFAKAKDLQNTTLIVLQDITDSNPVYIDATNTTGSITLDLNDYNISFIENELSREHSGFNIQNATALDFIITGKGTITAAASNIAAIRVQSSSLSTKTTLTIEKDVTAIGHTGVMVDKYQTVAPGGNGITVNIAGTVKSVNNGIGVYVNGSITEQQPVINVMSTARIEADSWGMYLAGNNKTTVASGAQISGTGTGIEIRAGELTLNDCTVTGGSGELWANANGSGTTVGNAAVAVSQHNTNLPITVTVNGGTYTGTAAFYQFDGRTDTTGTSGEVKTSITRGTFLGQVAAETGVLVITGGRFSTDVAAYCTTDYQCNKPTEDEPLYTVTKKDADEIDVKRSLTLDNSLTMNYKVKLPHGYTSARVEFKFYNDYTKAFETTTVTGVLNEGTGRYESAFTGINPQRMTDTLKATVYATNVDTQEETAFPVDDFSAAQYCNVLLASDYNKNGAYNELVGNLVAYGTAAQLYQKYHTDKLVSSVVTGGTVVQHPLTDVVEVNELTAVTDGVSIEKKSLVLSNAFAIRVKFALEGDTTIDQVTFKVEADATTATISQFEKETLSDGTVYYYFDFAGLNSKQLGSTVTFTAVVDGNDNDVLAFSANTYLKLMSNVAGVSTELKNLLAALYNYGYTCKNFEA